MPSAKAQAAPKHGVPVRSVYLRALRLRRPPHHAAISALCGLLSHIYAQELPERRIRDYDNLELKQFLDVAASFILTDDNGLLCDAYNTTELGEEDCTRLFLMDSTQFPAWLAERQNSVKTISDF